MRLSDCSADVCSSDRRGGGAANVPVGGDGDVALVSATGIGGASATSDGAVAGNVNASSNGTSTTYTDISVVDGAVPVSGSTKTTSTAVGKAADVSVGEDGSVGGSVSVNEIGRAQVCNPVPNANLVCRLLLSKK